MRLARRLAAVLTALTLAYLPLTGASAQTTTNELPLNVTVTRLTPAAPHAGQILTLSGLISNTTDLEYDKLGVVLRLSSEPLLSRGDLLAVADSTEHLPFSDDAGAPETIVSVLPGGTVPYKLEVPIDELHLTSPGVYRIGVEVFHIVDGDRVYDGRVNTFLPWVPASANVAPLHVAWLWPLLSKPRLAPDGSFTDDVLGAEVSPQGRLGRLLNVAKQALGYRDPIRLTPVVDPETVQELTLMADPAHPYTVKPIGSSQPAIPGAYRTEAASFLAELRAVMAKTTSVATPYADPDIEAWTSAQASVLITQARSTGLADRLPGVAGGLLWPPDGALSDSTLDLLTVSGLVLGPKAYPLPPASTPGYTPTATASVTRPGGTVPAVVIDDGLTRLATKRVRAGEEVLLHQRYVAETAAIAVESAPSPRALVIAPDRRWSPTDTIVRRLVSDTGRLPWLRSLTVPQALEQDPVDPDVARGPLHVPPGTPTLPGNLANGIASANDELAGYRSILCPVVPSKPGASTAPATTGAAGTGSAASSSPGASTAAACASEEAGVLTLQQSLYRAGSTAFRVPDSGGEKMLAATSAALAKQERKVRITTRGTEVLVGNRAKVPIRIVNELNVPVQVQLVLNPLSPALTTSPAETVIIQPGQPAQVNVTISTAKAGAGSLPVEAQLLTPDSRPYGPPAHLSVKVSVYGAVVVWISAAVGGLLLLAVVVRIYRRIQNARRGNQPPTDPATTEATA